MKRVAIIGAGPAGLAAAYTLAKSGIAVEVFEASDAVGGMAKTVPMWGQLVDLGPHRFFSSDPRVNCFWLEAVGRDYSMVPRISRIFYNGKFFAYPLEPFDALRELGLSEALRCVLSYLRAKAAVHVDSSTFEGWVTSRFGTRLFEIFFKSYSEKLWGISCNELSSEFAAQRIKKLSLFESIKAAAFGNRRSKHKTLVDEFAYPNLGAGQVYDSLASRIVEMGGKVHLNCSISAVLPATKDTAAPGLTLRGLDYSFDHVISTMPITLLTECMGAPNEIRKHAAELKFRNTILVYLLLDEPSPFPDQWVYVHSKKLRTGRITNFRNWTPAINRGKAETILCLEYWCYDQDAIWSADDAQLIEIASEEILLTGLVAPGSARDGSVIRVPKCYPVYALGYRQHLRPIEEYLSEQRGVSAIGRYGSFKYNNQDHSILMGILAADNILNHANHNLWELNSDYEYQESSTITASGLSKG